MNNDKPSLDNMLQYAGALRKLEEKYAYISSCPKDCEGRQEDAEDIFISCTKRRQSMEIQIAALYFFGNRGDAAEVIEAVEPVYALEAEDVLDKGSKSYTERNAPGKLERETALYYAVSHFQEEQALLCFDEYDLDPKALDFHSSRAAAGIEILAMLYFAGDVNAAKKLVTSQRPASKYDWGLKAYQALPED